MKHQLKYVNHALLATLLATKALIAHFSPIVRSNLFALHFAFILHLTSRQHFLSSSSGPTGNLVKINTKEKAALRSLRCDCYDCEMIIMETRLKCPGVFQRCWKVVSIASQPKERIFRSHSVVSAVIVFADHWFFGVNFQRSRCLHIIYNLYWLSIIPVMWLKGFSPVSYLGEIQATWDTRDM